MSCLVQYEHQAKEDHSLQGVRSNRESAQLGWLVCYFSKLQWRWQRHGSSIWVTRMGPARSWYPSIMDQGKVIFQSSTSIKAMPRSNYKIERNIHAWRTKQNSSKRLLVSRPCLSWDLRMRTNRQTETQLKLCGPRHATVTAKAVTSSSRRNNRILWTPSFAVAPPPPPGEFTALTIGQMYHYTVSMWPVSCLVFSNNSSQ